jgi:hypothetical protein
MDIRDAEVVLGRTLDPKEREEVLNDHTVVQSYYQSMLTKSAHQKLENCVKDLEERRKDIKKLERV